MHPIVRAVAGSACLFLAALPPLQAQTLTPLSGTAPKSAGLFTMLLTDGRVLVQGKNYSSWFALSPDINGSYVNGSWTTLASLPSQWGYAPDAFASAVWADGRVIVLGGEYNGGQFVLTNLGALYDPVANAWTALAAPPGWTTVGDSPSVVVPGGQFVVGQKLTQQVASLDPATLQWSLLGSSNKSDFNAEEGWTLMPDGSVLTADVKNVPNTERFMPWMGAWLSDGSTPKPLAAPDRDAAPLPYPGGVYDPPGEIGPAILRPDGTVFATGATTNARQTAHTAIYTPGPTSSDPGTWSAGPDFPAHDSAGDSSAVLLPSGHVLVLGLSGTLYEFDGSHLTAGPSVARGSFLLPLPSGQVLVSGARYSVYTPAGQPQPAWAPAITSLPASLARGSTYTVGGTQFNGLSQGAAYGDEQQNATNYPLVRITNVATGHVFYAHTHHHSTMAVATGSQPVSTQFDVPANAETGPCQVQVVANGIASAPVPAHIL